VGYEREGRGGEGLYEVEVADIFVVVIGNAFLGA
jgi:hypothetical protein